MCTRCVLDCNRGRQGEGKFVVKSQCCSKNLQALFSGQLNISRLEVDESGPSFVWAQMMEVPGSEGELLLRSS